MNPGLNKIIDAAKVKFGLDAYHLHTHQINRSVNMFNETVYTLGMEWLPAHAPEQEEEGYNPEGTAVIDIDVSSGLTASVIFVGGRSYASKLTFPRQEAAEMISWLEHETGLRHGEHFHLHREEERHIYFKAGIGSTALSPSGSMEIECDEEGRLIKFSKYGYFPSADRVNIEAFSLSFESVESLAKEQLKLLEMPSFEQKRLQLVYGVEEIYITNDQSDVIPFDLNEHAHSYVKLDKVLTWQEPSLEPFDRKELQWNEEVTYEQALAAEPHPDAFPLSKLELEKSENAVLDLLRKVYPNDSGQWVLKTLHREKGYIQAALKAVKQEQRVFQRKLKIMIDSHTLQAVNYMDSKAFLEMFDSFEAAGEAKVAKEAAYEMLKGRMTLEPCYVYDFELGKYVLCGKLDCQYAVDAVSGDVIA